VAVIGLSLYLGRAGHCAELPPSVPSAAPAVASPGLSSSPVDYFRRLLTSDPAELTRLLEEKPVAQRQLLEAKLREYRELPPAEREARLSATETRWYLRPLLAMQPQDRVSRLKLVPERYRAAILERLRAWDGLSPEARQDLLQFELVLRQRSDGRTSSAGVVPPLPGPLAVEMQLQLNRELAQWQELSGDRQQALLRRFETFFEQSPSQQEKTLGSLPDEERTMMESTLRAFARLAPGQRRQCLDAFAHFANLSETERADFFRNADVWRRLTAEERNTWRRLVSQMPPLPPGLGSPPLPPIPRVGMSPASAPALAATNRQPGYSH
jgi:hypothetical protein